MKVLNVHRRVLNKPKTEVIQLFSTLATKEDQVWPSENWPAIRFREGVNVGSQGGHGPIRYQITAYQPDGLIVCQFQKPKGFHGIHQLELRALDNSTTEIKHTIRITTSGLATLYWVTVIRWLHDALIEDAFDKVENHFSAHQTTTPWNWWVRLLRSLLK